jgi:hypothetical protein
MQELAKARAELAKAQEGNGLTNAGLTASQYAACRESAQTIIRNELQRHEREAAAWRWLDAAMEVHKPSAEEEAALWDVLCRARRERF